MSGPYRGLSQNSSAVEVTTVIHEQFNALDNMKQRGEIRGIGLGLAVDVGGAAVELSTSFCEKSKSHPIWLIKQSLR